MRRIVTVVVYIVAALAFMAIKEGCKRFNDTRRRAAEEAKYPPEYYIEHNLELPDSIQRMVFDEVTYSVDTGNEIRDKETMRVHRDRFVGKHIKVSGQIKKVETTMFGNVEIEVYSGGHGISAKFEGMSKDEAMNLSKGDVIKFEGDISGSKPAALFGSSRKVLMGRCSMIR